MLCKHFGECGGCKNQDLEYENQLGQKADYLNDLLKDFWQTEIEVVPSLEIFYYRNKVELSFDRMQYDEPPPDDFIRETVLGFHKKGRWYFTLDTEECLIYSADMPMILERVRNWYREEELTYFDSRKSTGLLKYLVLRKAHYTNDKLLILVTDNQDIDCESFVKAVNSDGYFSSVYHAKQGGTQDAVNPDSMQLIDGKERLDEELHLDDGQRQLKFSITPLGFFQVNPKATETLYQQIREWVRASKTDFLYDLYGGSGGIAFSCSDLVDEIISVESFAPASEDGRTNAALNGIGNVSFETEKVEKWLGNQMHEKSFRVDSTVIIDPPRSAMHPKALSRLVEIGPEQIIYISCNPKLFARELALLTNYYEIKEVKAFDLFPHTDHVELATLFNKKNG
ncbi:MAG: 23S rRNA (uracil(1939)-C(5))-methyltransferase RlmD [Lentisphaeria bacterium]|nr:23S rRNA (uracil(1939)-C(5))-methyltransferase RlmD [Lentisphaeria bacterium]